MNMKKWLGECAESKKPLPILSYPAVSLIGVSVKEAVTDSGTQAEIMKAVADRCDTAASVTVMDLSVEAECFGAKISFSDNAVPAVEGTLITSAEEAKKLKVPEIGSGRSEIFIDAVKKAKELITDRPVLAGAAAPFSLAGRLMDVTEIMFWCFDEPDTVKFVLEKCTEFLINYINALKAAGADGVILAEPVAGLLSPALEAEFSAPYTKRLAEAVKNDSFAVIYHNCGQGVIHMTDSIFANGCDAYHFGNAIDLCELIKAAPTDKPVMGNIDPVGLFKDGTPEEMKDAVNALLNECAAYPNFLLSSGCDIPPNAKWENIDAFFKASESFYED